MRWLTERQTYDAMLCYIKYHADKMSSREIAMLYEWGRYDKVTSDGYPMSIDPREYDEFLTAVDRVLDGSFEMPGV